MSQDSTTNPVTAAKLVLLDDQRKVLILEYEAAERVALAKIAHAEERAMHWGDEAANLRGKLDKRKLRLYGRMADNETERCELVGSLPAGAASS